MRQGCLQQWFGDTGAIGKDDKRRERPSGMNRHNQKNQSTKSPQKNNFFVVKKASNKRDMHKYKFGVKSPRSMKLHLKIKPPTVVVEGMVKQDRDLSRLKGINYGRWPVLRAGTRKHNRETRESILCNGGNASS
ncbi:hypothetical protein QL285_062001 [Trifolium repens]|nr:hypothetical protein QL285_062001 [Trifolium repens]